MKKLSISLIALIMVTTSFVYASGENVNVKSYGVIETCCDTTCSTDDKCGVMPACCK